ncbi:AI-2E family transporter [Xanthobacter dioxanivorans]|uniref:AI-2E family transporter n=1 Tax=Xanthobacter dioxanivorans TaxID=2528964 RepID=A0A974PKN3_9HYPH|nr:AI-2E family transporter [Xanthobacter dioxanivorans]QRG05342.1 AI-2E family transporter [Xanthobacter dioxanivorans]
MASDWLVARRVAVACVVLALAYFSFKIIDVILQVFAAILLSLALHALAEPFARLTRCPERYAVFPVALLAFGGTGLALYLFGSTIQTQVTELLNELPAAWAAFEQRFHLEGLGSDLIKRAEAAAPSSDTLISAVQGVTTNVFQVLLGVFLVVVGGIYFAASPDLYRRMFLSCWSKDERPAVEHKLDAISLDLRHFLKAQLIAMVVVGLLTFAGLSIVGVPSSLALALFAGLAEFVPMVGPVVSAAPAVLIALTLGVDTGLWTLLVFVIVQQTESNIITPLLQQRMVSLPPAVTLFAVVAFGNFFGVMGIVLATPLTVLAFAAFKSGRPPADAA